MASRVQRHKRIAELVASHTIPNQQDLQDHLAAEGIVTTQATLSRDLQDLGVLKGPAGYVVGPGAATPEDRARTLERTLRRELLSVQPAAAIVVLQTRPGHANSLAVELDATQLPEVVGTVAGDDTIFIATQSAAQSKSLVRFLKTLAQHE
ncbi:MAG: hypothetical protein V3V08_07840 [Nannocystaceae bacterium]